jgi:phospho-2-dehydro-3-deoxyheptonate aldolase
MIKPIDLKKKYSSKDISEHIENSRDTISDIINLKDNRLLTIV